LGGSERIMSISIISYRKNSLDLRPTWVTTSPRERIEFVSQGSTVHYSDFELSCLLFSHFMADQCAAISVTSIRQTACQTLTNGICVITNTMHCLSSVYYHTSTCFETICSPSSGGNKCICGRWCLFSFLSYLLAGLSRLTTSWWWAIRKGPKARTGAVI
jgi:hypothetical protein